MLTKTSLLVFKIETKMSFYFEFSLVLVNIRYFSFCFSCLFWVSVQNISSLCPGDEAIITRAAPQSKKTQGKELYAGAPLPIRKNQQTLSLLVKFKLNWNEWMYGKVSLVGWLAVSSCNSLSLSLPILVLLYSPLLHKQ